MESVTDPKMLENRVFYRLGEFTFDNRKKVLVLGLLSCLMMTSLMAIGPDWADSWGEGELESVSAIETKNDAFSETNSSSQGFTLLVFHPSLDDSSDVWQQSVIEALKEFNRSEYVSIVYSWDVVGDERDKYIFQNDTGSWARNVLTFDLERKEAKVLYSEHKDSVSIDGDFETWRTANTAIEFTFDDRIKTDLVKAELISGPLSLIILGIVFGTLLAALLPVGIGILTVMAAVGVTYFLSNITTVDVYSVNIISLIGIGISIDYSLFLVNRFREELGRGREIRTATAMTVATAGKAVFFSGVTVAIGLMGLLFFENTNLPSLGIGGTLAVTIGMIYSLVVLPAVLAMLGDKINTGRRLPFSFSIKNEEGEGVWSKIANTVMKYPWAVLIPTLIILLGAGLPFLQAEYSLASRDALPPEDESRVGLEKIDEIWTQSATNSALVVIDFDGQDPLSENNIRILHRWMVSNIEDERVLNGFGYALPDASMSESDVVNFWLAPNESLDNGTIELREYLRQEFISQNVTYLVLSLNGPITGSDSRDFVSSIRDSRSELLDDLSIGESGSLEVAGFAALSLDTLDAITDNLPIAIIFILIATIILIFIQVRSVIIPFKAIVMNILSISASFGMLVVVFQWGYGSELLNFTPQPIEATTPVIIFCIVFGLSMDYEVLMLSRIHEEWERTGDNTLAVANGLQRTGRLITGAAAVMVVVFSAFGLSSVIILKQIGFGLALAIFLDATIVRALVVPATMRLMGKANWWSPKWMDRLFSVKKPVQLTEENED